MTAIDLTRDQCAALADYLKERVELCHQGYDLIELLVLAQRALRNAAKPAGPALLCDVTKSGTPEEGAMLGGVAREAARPSGAVQAGHCRPPDRLPLQPRAGLPGPVGRPVRRRERRQADPNV